MITFSFRGKRDNDPKWGPRGRRVWISDCGRYRIEERHEFEGLTICKRERYLALYIQGPRVLGRSRSKKAAIARCTQHDNQRKRRNTDGSEPRTHSGIVRRR